jgi:hypothetical protein
MQVKEKGECFQSNNFLQIGKRGRLNHLDKSKGSQKKKIFSASDSLFESFSS